MFNCKGNSTAESWKIGKQKSSFRYFFVFFFASFLVHFVCVFFSSCRVVAYASSSFSSSYIRSHFIKLLGTVCSTEILYFHMSAFLQPGLCCLEISWEKFMVDSVDKYASRRSVHYFIFVGCVRCALSETCLFLYKIFFCFFSK